MDHFKNSAKAYASGLAAFVGSVSIILSTQRMPEMGIQYITQYEWSTVILSVLAAYGITWRVPNTSPTDKSLPSSLGADSQPVKQGGAHVA